MARIRSVHPGLLTDEAWMTLTVEAPLACALFIGLLTEADDGGVFDWKPLTIKARILPAPSIDVAGLLDTLVRNRFIMRYEAEGRSYGAIRNFMRFQRPKKPNPVHPKTAAAAAWCATGSELVPHHPATDGGIPPQMEDVGGRMEENCSDADASDAAGVAARPSDPLKARIFGPVLSWLRGASGKTEAQCRSVLGQWCRDFGDGAVLEACTSAEREAPVEPVAYVTTVLQGAKPNGRAHHRKSGGRAAVPDDYHVDMLAGVGLGPH